MSEMAPVKAQRETHLERRVAQLAESMPELRNLTPGYVDAIAKGVVVDELKAAMWRAIAAQRVDCQAEQEAFLSDSKSTHTREAYSRALQQLSTWLELHNLPATNLTPRLADDLIRAMRAMSGRDSDNVRVDASACSSFFSFLERRFDEIRNPFRGSRARPASTWTAAVIPMAADLKIFQAEPALAEARSTPGCRVGSPSTVRPAELPAGSRAPRGDGEGQPG